VTPVSKADIFDQYTQMDYFIYKVNYTEEFANKEDTAVVQYRYYTYKTEVDGKLGFELQVRNKYQAPEHIYRGDFSNYRVDTNTGYVYDANNDLITNYGRPSASILYSPNTQNLNIGDNLDPYTNYTIQNISSINYLNKSLEVLNIGNTISNSTINMTMNGEVERSMGFYVNLKYDSKQTFYVNPEGQRTVENYNYTTEWSLIEYHLQNQDGDLPIVTRTNFYENIPLFTLPPAQMFLFLSSMMLLSILIRIIKRYF